jgi:ATP-dependent exoDNAse (exonuclease V) beta subunit
VGASDESLLRLRQLGNLGAALDRLEGVVDWDPGELERLSQFRQQLMAARAECDQVAPDRLLARALDAADYESGLGPRARANVRKFLGLVREWFARRPRALSALIEELEALRASDPDEASAPAEDSSNAVRVMTIHSAKGLEFPIVFLAALHKGVARNWPPLAFSPKAGLVARWRDPVADKSVMDLSYAAFAEELKGQEEQEGHRLLYVAMTRAEEHLVLSFASPERGLQNWAVRLAAAVGLDGQPDPALPFALGVMQVSTAPEKPAALAARAAGEIEERPGRPEVTGQHDATVSASSVWLYQLCPRRYYLARYLGWQPVAEPRPSGSAEEGDDDLDASEFGSQVHNLLAGVPVDNPDSSAVELAARFRVSPLGRRAASAARAEREFDFLIELDDILLQGRIDLWFEEGGELVLIDYKTDDVKVAEAADHARSYALQLHLYALALERLTGRLPGRAYVYLLRPDVAVPLALDAGAIEEARETVAALGRAQSTLDFPLRVAQHCYRCPYFRGLCPAA